MTTPVSDLDERDGDPRACAAGWDETRRVLEPGDGRCRPEQDEDPPPILVFAVTPTEVLVFTRGAHAAHRF
jgi:hypothetical protein